MPLTHAHEEKEVTPDLQRLYSEARAALDLPFVPTLFKLLAKHPQYLKPVWNDIREVAHSREYQASVKALEDFVRSQAVGSGWQFPSQQKVLLGQRFSQSDIDLLAGVASTFSRALVQMTLIARLLQRGYAGGQRGRVTEAKQAGAISRMVTLNVPNEREAGMRVWLIYMDIRRVTGVRSIPSLYRALTPFPGYLASTWLDSKKLLKDPLFRRATEESSRRAVALMTKIPVRDHRVLCRGLEPMAWREIEETVDTFARTLPQFMLVSRVWQRSFPSLGAMPQVA
jgi:hypothetical protein